jgi:PhzF family phenazine biosynthesis protein
MPATCEAHHALMRYPPCTAMAVRITQVNAFTNRPFGGNPAAVCVLPEPRPDAWMQDIAREMNLSETAFLMPRNGGYDLRWFTPAVEVDLCGHATLASAHVLWETSALAPDQQACFHTRSGLLTAIRRGDLIELDLPAKPEKESTVPRGLYEALGVPPHYVGMSQFDVLIQVESEAIVRKVHPDFDKLRSLPVRGIIVTARADAPSYDVVSRFFAPAVGVDEDPVTGSAHCVLATFWAPRLGKSEFVAYQASPRGGIVHVTLRGSRVQLGGQAVTIFEGDLRV